MNGEDNITIVIIWKKYELLQTLLMFLLPLLQFRKKVKLPSYFKKIMFHKITIAAGKMAMIFLFCFLSNIALNILIWYCNDREKQIDLFS